MSMFEYNIKKSGGNIVIIPVSISTPQKSLSAEIGTGQLKESDCSCEEFSFSSSESKLIYGVLGIVNIFPVSYLCVISEVKGELSLKIEGHDVYEIKKIELVSLAAKDREENIPYKEGIKKLLSSGFYFSYTYDLTKRLQRTKGDDRFWWNKNLYDEFKNYNISKCWAIKAIQGYVGYSKIVVDSHPAEISLVSRRRYLMAGTRFGKRGIDDQGNVANFVESEQIMSYQGYTFSFVQIRGSVPAFWEQTGITAELQLTRSLKMDQCAFEKHFNDMINEYDKVLWANLLNNKRSYELKLIQRFEELVKLFQGANNRYLFFNFHTECSKDNFSALDEKLKLGNLAKHFSFYITNGSKLVKKQIGVMRTNCLDCLDRTNVCQAYYSFKAFHLQLNFLRNVGLLDNNAVELTSGEDNFEENKSSKETTNCLRAIRAMWAKNGDALSLQYAGTHSTSTEVTINDRTSVKGKITHKMTSIERFFKNNITSKDDVRQDCIDLFTCQHERSKTMVSHKIEATMMEQQHVYSETKTYSMLVFSWNLAGNEPRYEMDFTQILKSPEFNQAPDIAIIGFQETVKLNAINIFKGHDKSRVEALKSFALDGLNDLESGISYNFLGHSAMVGLLVMCFCKSTILSKINDIQTTKVKSGLGGSFGNKGGVLISFNLDDTSIIAACVHLESGQK